MSEPTYSLRARGGKPNEEHPLRHLDCALDTHPDYRRHHLVGTARPLHHRDRPSTAHAHNYDVRNDQLGKERVKVQCQSWAVAISLDGQ